jgi:hypothetical protein
VSSPLKSLLHGLNRVREGRKDAVQVATLSHGHDPNVVFGIAPNHDIWRPRPVVAVNATGIRPIPAQASVNGKHVGIVKANVPPNEIVVFLVGHFVNGHKLAAAAAMSLLLLMLLLVAPILDAIFHEAVQVAAVGSRNGRRKAKALNGPGHSHSRE